MMPRREQEHLAPSIVEELRPNRARLDAVLRGSKRHRPGLERAAPPPVLSDRGTTPPTWACIGRWTWRMRSADGRGGWRDDDEDLTTLAGLAWTSRPSSRHHCPA